MPSSPRKIHTIFSIDGTLEKMYNFYIFQYYLYHGKVVIF